MESEPRLLIVDDERLMRMSLRMVLGEAGYRVDTASTVDQARDLLDRYRYRLLITDLILPDGRGVDVIRYARRLVQDQEAILLTGSDSPLDEEEALLAGASAVIHKPCELSTVVSATFRATGRERSSADPGKTA